MARFKFRLQKLLEYRQLQEQWAKDAYLEAVARRTTAELEIEQFEKRRLESLRAHPTALDERLALDNYVTRLEDEIRASEAAKEVLAQEAEKALDDWNVARQSAEAFEKLRQSEYEAWQLDESRREQQDLDEWSVFRRAA